MSTGLLLNDFVKIDQIYQKDKFKQISPFELLGSNLATWLDDLLKSLCPENTPVIKGEVSEHAHITGPVYVAKGARIDPTAMIQGSAYIGPDAEVRHGAFIRGNVYVGARCVVGHATEVKGSVFFDDAKAGHFAYVGDSHFRTCSQPWCRNENCQSKANQY